MMKIVYHAGRCCGIKTIAEFQHHPSYNEGEIAESKYKEGVHNRDKCGFDIESKQNLYYGKALPKQTGEERLTAYIDFLRVKRKSGLVEIALAKGSYIDQSPWFDVLKGMGFKRVARFRNSNSGNMVSVFHLVLLDGSVADKLIDKNGDDYDEDATDIDDEECDEDCDCDCC